MSGLTKVRSPASRPKIYLLSRTDTSVEAIEEAAQPAETGELAVVA